MLFHNVLCFMKKLVCFVIYLCTYGFLLSAVKAMFTRMQWYVLTW